MDVTVVVSTFGDRVWAELAERRAIPSAEAQGVPVVHAHDETLAAGRNAGLAQVETEFVVHLDADDELAPGYVEALGKGTADMRAPAVSYVRKGRPPRSPAMPRVWGHKHDCSADCLPEGNWMVIGTAVRAELARSVGGWREFAWSEDWDLWLRCWQTGGTIEAIPEAVYVAHVRFDSRNRAPSTRAKLIAHEEIHKANFPVRRCRRCGEVNPIQNITPYCGGMTREHDLEEVRVEA